MSLNLLFLFLGYGILNLEKSSCFSVEEPENDSKYTVKNVLEICEQQIFKSFFNDLLSYTLAKGNVFYIIEDILLKDTFIEELLSLNWYISYMISTTKTFDSRYFGKYISRNRNTTFIIITYYEELDHFFQRLSVDNIWGPRYILIMNLNSKKKINNILSNSSIQRSEFILITELVTKLNRSVIEVYSLYAFHKSEQKQKIFVGLWRKPRTKNEVFVGRKSNINGKIVKTSSVCFDFPFLYENENNICIGANIEMFDIISKKLNFSYEIHLNKDNEWGTVINGTYTGMLSDLAYKNKEIIINAYIINYDANEDFEQSGTYHNEGYALMVEIPPPFPDWKKLAMPFSFYMWVCVFASVIMGMSIIMVSLRFTSENNYYSEYSAIMVSIVTRV